MSNKNSNYLVAFVLLVMIFVTAMSFLKTPEVEFVPVERNNTGPHIWIPEQYTPLEPPFNPVSLGIFLGETKQIGCLTTLEAKVTKLDDPSATGYGTVYGLERTGIAYPVGYDTVYLIDSENQFVPHPLDLKTSTIALELNNVLDSKEISVEGELYNCTAWDGSWFITLRIDNQYIYSVKYDPNPLTGSQVELYTDSVFYHVNDTAHVNIRNLSEDWLEAGRTLRLYKEMNGTWAEVQSYPDGYLVTLEIALVFPGSTISHELPLLRLPPSYYRLVKEANHPNSPKIEVETHFTIIEELVDYSNSTHVFGLESINCTLPEIPDVIPIARKVDVPINSSEAEKIAVNVFGFTEPYEFSLRLRIGRDNPIITFATNEKSLEFSTRYDIMYHGEYPDSFNNWNESKVIEIAEDFLASFEPYWVDETAVNYSLFRVGPSHISSASHLTESVREVGVRYQNTLEGVPLSGPGADFVINVCRDNVSSCEIRRPVVEIEGYSNVTVSPLEAIQMMLRGESATPSIGFAVDQVFPRSRLLTVNSVQLIYYTSLYGEWLVPVYEIHSTARIDPVLYEEEITELVWYIYATDYSFPQIE
ncbi:hypothetical protein E4H04_11675 [Candidatus Bathyarchaeota archaeon]|nr:MAG: hypothetical protein E4H04_11675 [Candidatus Bathyarchaeota archaeon]